MPNGIKEMPGGYNLNHAEWHKGNARKHNLVLLKLSIMEVHTMDILKTHYEKLAATVISGLNKRQMDGYYLKTAKEAVELALTFLPDHPTVGFGGSMTLVQTGLLDALKADPSVKLLDRETAQTAAEKEEIYRRHLLADTYFMSSNAITTDGELINIDGFGNRVAALIFGPKEVVILAGMNKIVPSVEEGVNRVRNTATPPNCMRLNKQPPCASTGICSGCLSAGCICNQIVVTRRSGQKGRIKVLLIGEHLGF